MYIKRGTKPICPLIKQGLVDTKAAKYPTFANDSAINKADNKKDQDDNNSPPFIIEKDQNRVNAIKSFMSPSNINILNDKETNALSELVDDNKSSNASRTEEDLCKSDLKDIHDRKDKNAHEECKLATVTEDCYSTPNSQSVVVIETEAQDIKGKKKKESQHDIHRIKSKEKVMCLIIAEYILIDDCLFKRTKQ